MRVVEGLPTLRERGPMCACAAAPASRLLHARAGTLSTDDADTLSRGVQGLAIRLARRINGALRTARGPRRGKVWKDRYHARELKTPREVRNGLVYVLHNLKKHRPEERGLDVCSSAAAFAGWRDFESTAPLDWLPRPRTWLARVGWRRAHFGLLSIGERPR